MSARSHRATIAALAAALSLGAWGAFSAYRAQAGEPSERLADTWHLGRRVLDRERRDLREIPSPEGHRGREARLDELGDRVVLATIAAEDGRFYDHGGVDARALLRALAQNLESGRVVSGASTITQQLVKLLDHEGQPRERSLANKLSEAARAMNLEGTASKSEILAAYLARLPYGHGLTGPEAAARGYFGVAARDLSWAQAAHLAALPRAPSYLDSYAHPERVEPRRRAVLDALHRLGALGDADHARAAVEAVTPRPIERPFLAPHFVDMLGKTGQIAPSGETVTTLDAGLQRDVEGLVRTHLAAIHAYGATNAAVLVVDNTSAEVLAYVGSAAYDDASIAGQVDLVRAPRQPGSALKPFVYALAIARGRTPSDMLADVPTSFAEKGGSYAPANFDGTFLGPVPMRDALAGSLNVPAIRVASELPSGSLLGGLRALGLATLDEDAGHYGLALALGSGEVTMLDLASAYVALARGGERVPLRVRLDAPRAAGERVLDAGAAAAVTEMLADPLARVRGLHGMGPFDLGYPVAVKTGTSSGHRDTWTAGYTHERTVLAWVGNASGEPTRGLTGASGAGPLFADVMRRAMEGVPARGPLWDDSLLHEVEVCPLSGKLAGPACPEHAARRFVRGHEPGETCAEHARATRRGDARPGEPPFRCDAVGAATIVVLPEVFDAWLATKPLGAPGEDPRGLPWFRRSAVPGCTGHEGRPAELALEGVASGSVYLLSGRAPGAEAIDVRASVVGDRARVALRGVDFLVDGVVVARSGAPYRAQIPLARGDHELLVRPSDPGAQVGVAAARYSVR
jgi:penicillin-binding protein 1C